MEASAASDLQYLEWNDKMKKSEHYFLRWTVYIVLFIILFGCNDSDYSNRFGSPISNRKTIPISDLFDDTTKYDGKTVTIEGVIDMQDQNGYWFYLQDEEARIYVDLYNAGFSIPDMTKKKVLAEGKIGVKLNILSLLATGAEHRQ